MSSTKSPRLDLARLREQIENIDRELLENFKERMQLSEDIAAAKIQAAAPFRDKLREGAVLKRVRQMAVELKLDAHQVEHLFRLIIEMSITHQQAHLQALGDTPLRVAYQGVEGSFSHLTAQRRYAGRDGGVVLTGYETFREAAESVKRGTNDLALLPIENSTAGSINETYDLLTEGGLKINAEAISQIHHCLLALPGTRKEDLRVILSHPQALMQCERFLRSLPEARGRTEFDTAGAARKVREANDPTLGAIASESAAVVFGLDILEREIQNQADNYTRFVEVAIEADTCPSDVPCKTSLMLVTGHRPGDLADVLTHFSSRNINLNKLESRPYPGRPWQYRFYLDLEGHARSEPLTDALVAIAEHTQELAILGTYPSADLHPVAGPSGQGEPRE